MSATIQPPRRSDTLSEAEVRRLRDNLYGTEPRWRTDAGWLACRENWMKPENIEWLKRQPQNQRT